MKQIIYAATKNPRKITDLQLLFSEINPNISVEQVLDYTEVDESGQTLAENSKLKILPYCSMYRVPVIGNDFGLFFDENILEIQDGTKVKRNALKGKQEDELSQEEIGHLMFEFYNSLAKKYGGQISCEGRDVFTILNPQGEISQTNAVRYYSLEYRDITDYDIYHPLNSLRRSLATGTFISEMTPEENLKDKKPLINALDQLTAEYRVELEKLG